MLKRFLLLPLMLLVFYFLSSGAAQAQLAAASPARLTRQDTASAVHELFAARRTGGITLTGFGGVFTGLFIYGMFDTPPSSTGETLLVTGGATLVGFVPLGVGVGKLVRYSRAREQQVLTDYALGGRLPHKYERRLRRGFRPVPGNTSWPELVTAETLARVPAAARPGTTVPAGAVSTTYSLADSLDAVLGLFVAKRFAGQLPSLGLVPLGSLLAGSSNADGEYNYSTGRFEESKPSAGAVAAGLTMALGSVAYMYIHNAPYSMAKFDALRVACEAGAPIPAGLRAQIKPRHFDQGREMRNRLARKAARKNR